MEFVFWNGIKIFGYDYKRMIAYLKTLDKEYLDNLSSCNAAKGHCSFVWKFYNKKFIDHGIDIPACEEWPYGDYWSTDNVFIGCEMADINYEFIRFEIMLNEIKGQTLINVIDYWAIANNIPSWRLDRKEIYDKIIDLNKMI
jgi:hypothetical protein